MSSPALELKMVRDSDDVHVWELPTFGRVRLPRRPRGDVQVSAPGHGDWVVSRGAQRRTWQVTEGGYAVAAVDDGAHSIVCGARTWTIPRTPLTVFKKPGPWLLYELGREIMTFDRREWGWRPPTVTIIDEAAARADPRLTLVAAWTANRMSVSIAP